jgi:hypothetical protein
MRRALGMSAALWASASAPLLAQDADPATELDAPREAEPALAVTPVVYVAPHLNLGREDHGTGSVFGTWGSVGFFSGNLRNDAATVAMFDLGMRIGLGTDASLTVDWGLADLSTPPRIGKERAAAPSMTSVVSAESPMAVPSGTNTAPRSAR